MCKVPRYEVTENTLTITLSRPDHLNAFTNLTADELVDAFQNVGADDNVGVVIVAGEGRAFCVGMDLRVDGKVFGLDKSRRPTLADVSESGDDPAIRDTVPQHQCRASA